MLRPHTALASWSSRLSCVLVLKVWRYGGGQVLQQSKENLQCSSQECATDVDLLSVCVHCFAQDGWQAICHYLLLKS